MSETLRPCPHCVSGDIDVLERAAETTTYFAVCRGCGAKSGDYDAPEVATAYWDNRQSALFLLECWMQESYLHRVEIFRGDEGRGDEECVVYLDDGYQESNGNGATLDAAIEAALASWVKGDE